VTADVQPVFFACCGVGCIVQSFCVYGFAFRLIVRVVFLFFCFIRCASFLPLVLDFCMGFWMIEFDFGNCHGVCFRFCFFCYDVFSLFDFQLSFCAL